MTSRRIPYVALVVVLVACAMVARPGVRAQQAAAPAVDADDIAGVVTGPKGPEAGVWVIAETASLPTKFVKIVVTDDQGRYLLPDLPKATYSVWVRGYGLVDSRKVQAAPGRALNLTATVAPSPLAAAQYYPAGYWFSMIQPPAESEFPGTGPEGNGISPNIRNQAEWLQRTRTAAAWRATSWAARASAKSPKRSAASPRRSRHGTAVFSRDRRAGR
jgi:hypothetical protein